IRQRHTSSLLGDGHQVPHLQNQPAGARRVRYLDRMADAPQPQPTQRERLLLVEADTAADLCHRESLGFCLCSFRHGYAFSSSKSLPRNRATAAGSRSSLSATNVARTTLCGLAEPIDLVSTLWMPADSTTARTAPPAMMPVPSGAGLSSTDPAPKFPSTGCGIVAPFIGTRTSTFFAASIAFLIAEGTSFAC